jgi:rubredoxin
MKDRSTIILVVVAGAIAVGLIAAAAMNSNTDNSEVASDLLLSATETEEQASNSSGDAEAETATTGAETEDVPEQPDTALEVFAHCLTGRGVTMYGAWWCPHCQNQKKQFGSAFSFIRYVECSSPGKQDALPVCQAAKINGYPTWIFGDGSRIEGEASFETLAQRTSCPLLVK